MDSGPPNVQYYRLCTGSWQAPLDLRLTSLRNLFQSVSWLDALGFIAIRCVPHWLRKLETCVWFEGETIIHTTHASCMGLPIMAGREVITLSDDGEGLTLAGTQRIAPFWWRQQTVSATGHVDPEARTAHYQLTWFGSPMTQDASASPNAVTLEQSTNWFSGTQRLVRTGSDQ